MSRARLVTSFLGVALAVAAIALDDKRIAWGAMVVLVVALGISLRARRAQARRQQDD